VRNTKWAEKLRQQIRLNTSSTQNKEDPIPKTSGETRHMLISFMQKHLRTKHMFIAENVTGCSLESLLNEDIGPIQAQQGKEAEQKNVIVISFRNTTYSEPFNSIQEYFLVSSFFFERVFLLIVFCPRKWKILQREGLKRKLWQQLPFLGSTSMFGFHQIQIPKAVQS
jgi:hypothetical protein